MAGDRLVQDDAKRTVTVLLNGWGGMPAFKAQLAEEQIATIASYAIGTWAQARPRRACNG